MKIKAAFIFLGWIFLVTTANANDPIGTVLIAKGVVTANSQETGIRTLEKGANVFLGETISTAIDSFVVLKMIDKSKLSIRPQSEMTLKAFSEESGKEEALFDLVKGGLRALSGEIGKKNPEQFRVETVVASIGIRGTDFLVRICQEECSEEEANFGHAPRQDSGTQGSGTATKQKEIRRLDQDNNVRERSFIECGAVAEIKRGLYAAVFDGKIFVRKGDQEVDLEAIEAVFAQDTEIVCLGQIPHFIMSDDFLPKNPEETITLFNALRNIDEDRQQCEIPEA